MEEEINESEQVSDHFICAVCLDVLYKPVVLVCGHVTCFLCCYRSMNMRDQSHCSLCRHPYRHFPAICHTLDKFLRKMYPVSYSRRKKQTFEDEKQCSLGFALDEDCLSISEELENRNIEGPPSESDTEENKLNNGKVTIADVLCVTCSQVLFHPVVLNCGHVYCEACVTISEDSVIKCLVCKSRHPSGFPKVCKEIDYVLEEQFPSDYALRKNTAICREQIHNGNPSNIVNDVDSKLSYPTEENFLRWLTVNRSKYHPRVGCDMCGMCPIIGERYQCKDCNEKSGYDLCGDCHNNKGSNLPGRFNQKHTPHHRLELVKAVVNRDVLYRLLSGQLAAISAASRNRFNPINGNSESASSSLDDNHNDDDVANESVN